MRIATSQYHQTMAQTLGSAQSRLEHVMQQMATGKRLLLPSDDPVAGVRMSRLNREEAALAQYRENIGALSVRLTQNETALDSTVADMLQVRDLLVWASDGANVSEDLNAMAGSLVSLRDSLLYSANSRDHEGRYLFSGTASDAPTMVHNGTNYVFNGNEATQLVAVGNEVTQPANVNLKEMADLLNQLDATIAALQTPGVSPNDPAVRATLKANLEGTDATLSAVNAKIAGLGGAQNILATLDDTHANVSVGNQQALITLGQLDYGEAAIRLNGYSTALQATQKAYSRVSNLSLFNVL